MAIQASARQAYINEDGFIFVRCEGDLDEQTFTQAYEVTEKLVHELIRQGEPVNILAEVDGVGKVNQFVRESIVQVFRTWNYRKIAIFGASLYLRQIISLLILATGCQQSVRVFETEAAARMWLKL